MCMWREAPRGRWLRIPELGRPRMCVCELGMEPVVWLVDGQADGPGPWQMAPGRVERALWLKLSAWEGFPPSAEGVRGAGCRQPPGFVRKWQRREHRVDLIVRGGAGGTVRLIPESL